MPLCRSRTLLAPLLALLLLAVGASTAHAGAMTLNASIAGAGKVEAIAGTGSYSCDHSEQELETDEGGCNTGFYSTAFAVTLTLKATPAAGWKRAGWEGCDEVNNRSECVITGPITSRGYKTIKAKFEDNQGPVVTWDLKRHNPDSTIDLAWHTDEPATFECSVFGIEYTACTSPYHTHILAQGGYRWDIKAIDRNGSVTIFSAGFTDVQTVVTKAPPARTNATSATIEFDNVPGGRVDRFECRMDGGSWNVCTSPWKVDGLSEGPHLAEVRGFRDDTYEIEPSSARWSVDRTPPQTSLTGGPVEGETSRARTANLTLSTDEPARFECRLDGAAWSGCGSAPAYADLADGTHTFEGRAVDEAGNADPTPVVRTWKVDGTPAVTTVTGGPADGSTVASRTATFTFSAPGAATFFCKLDDSGWGECASPMVVKDLADGPHVFLVRSRDAAYNDEEPKRVGWTVDATAPVVTITSGPAAGAELPSGPEPRFTFTAPADATGGFECRVDGGAWAACTSPFTARGLAAGAHTFAVRARDALGNVDPAGTIRAFSLASPTSEGGGDPDPGPGTGGDPQPGPGTGGDPKPGPGTGGDPQPGPGTGGGTPSPNTGTGAGATPGGTGSATGPTSSATGSTSGTGAASASRGAAKPRLTAKAKGTAKVDRKGRFTVPGVKVACPAGGACTLTATATGRLTGTGTATVKAGGTATALKVQLARKTLTRLAGGRKVTVRVKLTLTGPGGTATTTIAVTLRR